MIKQKYWHKLFEASVIIKAINGIWETIAGFAILFISSATIAHAFGGEIQNLQHLSTSSKEFAGIYILAHGLINIFLAYFLYKEKLWAFWVSIGFFTASIVYLGYRVINAPSLMLYGLILFDIFFMYLTWHEFQYRRNLSAAKITPTLTATA